MLTPCGGMQPSALLHRFEVCTFTRHFSVFCGHLSKKITGREGPAMILGCEPCKVAGARSAGCGPCHISALLAPVFLLGEPFPSQVTLPPRPQFLLMWCLQHTVAIWV